MDKKVYVEVEWDGDNIPQGSAGALLEEEDHLVLISGKTPEGSIPVTLLNQDSAAGLFATLASQKERLSHSELAMYVDDLRKSGYTNKKIAEQTGLLEQDVSFYARLFPANEAIKEALDDHKISPSAVEPLLALSPEAQDRLTRPALQKKTVRGVRALIRADTTSQTPMVVEGKEEADDEIDPAAQLVLDLLSEADNVLRSTHPGMAVWSEGTGKIFLSKLETLRASVENLERIYDANTNPV
jgi:hypothetical protein